MMWEIENMICCCNTHAVCVRQQTQCDVAQRLKILHAVSILVTFHSPAPSSEVISKLIWRDKNIVKMQSANYCVVSAPEVGNKNKKSN